MHDSTSSDGFIRRIHVDRKLHHDLVNYAMLQCVRACRVTAQVVEKANSHCRLIRTSRAKDATCWAFVTCSPCAFANPLGQIRAHVQFSLRVKFFCDDSGGKTICKDEGDIALRANWDVLHWWDLPVFPCFFVSVLVKRPISIPMAQDICTYTHLRIKPLTKKTQGTRARVHKIVGSVIAIWFSTAFSSLLYKILQPNRFSFLCSGTRASHVSGPRMTTVLGPNTRGSSCSPNRCVRRGKRFEEHTHTQANTQPERDGWIAKEIWTKTTMPIWYMYTHHHRWELGTHYFEPHRTPNFYHAAKRGMCIAPALKNARKERNLGLLLLSLGISDLTGTSSARFSYRATGERGFLWTSRSTHKEIDE